jgi:hypothetical protein
MRDGGIDFEGSPHLRFGTMATLNEKKRDSLKSSTFGLPEERKYPMPDASHARNAKARASQQVKKAT